MFGDCRMELNDTLPHACLKSETSRQPFESRQMTQMQAFPCHAFVLVVEDASIDLSDSPPSRKTHPVSLEEIYRIS